MLQNPFLVIRYVSFSIILFLSLLSLIFAAWNVALSKSSGEATPGASVFLLFNGVASFFCIAISLVELVVVKVKMTKVLYECAWAGILAVLQLAASLAITTQSPVLCRRFTEVALCTSVTAQVPIAWLSTFIIMVYFLTLTITATVYAPSYPEIWMSSIYTVPWFASSNDAPPLSRKPSSSTSRSAERSNDIWDEEEKAEYARPPPTSRSCLSLAIAPWAKAFQNKRGLDRPFATRSQVLAANPATPTPPSKTHLAPIAARYLDISPPFPIEAEDDNKPIPYSTLSQWVRADTAIGRTVHTRPPLSPC